MQKASFFALVMLVSACSYNTAPGAPLGYEVDDDACSDGRDNDRDGLVDCDDNDCLYRSTVCGEVVPIFPQHQPEDSYAALP
jgi:hypothetical protein